MDARESSDYILAVFLVFEKGVCYSHCPFHNLAIRKTFCFFVFFAKQCTALNEA